MSPLALIVVEVLKLASEAFAAVRAGNPTADQLAITRAVTAAKVMGAVAAIDEALKERERAEHR